jgi:flagellar biosynthesis/type III secretory pathway M-ring protein FliF/YscJ
MLLLGGIAGIFFFLMFCVVCLGLILWAINEHVVANKYRHLVRLTEKLKADGVLNQQMPKGWSITYKEGRSTKTITVDAATEALAMLSLARQGIRYDHIVSSVKV